VCHNSVAKLDRDYLKRRGGSITITYAEGGLKKEDSPADTDCVRIFFLGAAGVGKTSLIRVRFNKYDYIVSIRRYFVVCFV